MKLLLAVCLLVLVQIIAAQRRCEAPRQFEATVHMHDDHRNEYLHQRMYYDATGMRTRHIDELTINKTTQYLDILRLYKTEKEYRLDMKTKECHMMPLKYKFRPFEIGMNATFRGEYWIGAINGFDGTGLLVEEYAGETENKGYYFSTWTPAGCIPVHDGYFSDATGYISTRFYDVRFGIRDAAVFEIPKECTG